LLQLQAIAVPPKSGLPAEGTLVILHGWGANAQDVLGLANFINLPNFQMIFPDAPFSHPHVPGGKMWYDFTAEFNFQSTPGFQSRPDISSSRQLLLDFLTSLEEKTDVPLSRTVLGGFSQGGAMTLDVGLTFPLAGLMVLSGYLHAPLQPQTKPFPPVLMVHGRQDAVVPLSAAHQARDSLQALNVDLQYHEFEMGHEIQPPVLVQMQKFVEDMFSDD
jgi:phospholipase/carboxylesterase